MTDASRKAKERASRKDRGEVRVEVWLSQDRMEDLKLIQKDGGGLSVWGAVSGAIWFAAKEIRDHE